MKHNISRRKNSVRIKIKQLITFDIERISLKNTFPGSMSEYVFMRIEVGSITKAAKDSKMGIGRRFVK